MTPRYNRFLHDRWRHHARTIMPLGWEGYRNLEPPRPIYLDANPWKGTLTESIHVGADQFGLSLFVGIPRDWTRVLWNSPDLIFDAFDMDGEPLGRIVRTPTKKQWHRFWLSMKRLGIWSWDRQYATDEQMAEGPAVWFADPIYENSWVRSHGVRIHPEESDGFCRAVQRLAMESRNGTACMRC